MQDSPQIEDRETSRGSSNRRRAIAVSVIFHLLLIGLLLFLYVPTRKPDAEGAGKQTASSETATPSTKTPRKLPEPAASPEVPKEQIEASIASQIDRADKLSEERKLSELEKNLSRLESISTEESVQSVTATIANTLGLEAGPAPLDDAPAGELDLDTSQIHDVRRTRNESGRWEYTSILVDAEGRTQEVPLSAAEGETVYATFEQMKQYPMAASIYRQVVMPLIQKTIAASELAEKAAAAAEQIQDAEQQSRSSDQVDE